MKTSTVIKVTIAVVIVGLGLFIGLLYVAFQPKTTDVSEFPPYAQFIGQSLSLERDAMIAQNLKEFSYETQFLLAEEDQPLFEGVERLYKLKKGHMITLTEVKHYKNTVSGFTHSIVVGQTYIPELEGDITFEYHWGKQVIDLDPEAPLEFRFPIALWQKEALQRSYIFE
ncbi:MAG: hypothetical protein AAFP76_09150 [Bacteroidota bacterium]